MPDGYLWAKAFHIIFSIAWMAGLLYLPRLFVYHCEAGPGSNRSEMLKVMERRLLWAIMSPAMIAVFLSGAWLLFVPGIVDWSAGWIYVKLAFVIGLAGAQGFMVRWCRAFAADKNKHPQGFFRVVNEVPTILMIGIVVLVVVKPF